MEPIDDFPSPSMEITEGHSNQQDEVVATTHEPAEQNDEEALANERVEGAAAAPSGVEEQAWDEDEQPSDEEVEAGTTEQVEAMTVLTNLEGVVPPVADDSAPRINSTIDTTEIDWDNLLLTSSTINQSVSRGALQRSFSFDQMPRAENTNVVEGSTPRHRRGASLTPASSQTPANQATTKFFCNTSSPVTPYSVESSVNSQSPLPPTDAVEDDDAYKDVNQPLLETMAGLEASTLESSMPLQPALSDDFDIAVDKEDQQYDADQETCVYEDNPPSLSPQTVPLPIEQEGGGITSVLAVRNSLDDMEVDLDAELARLEEQFLSNIGEAVDPSKTTTVDLPVSLSDLNVLDHLEQHEEQTTNEDASFEADKTESDDLVASIRTNNDEMANNTSRDSNSRTPLSQNLVEETAVSVAGAIDAPDQEPKTSDTSTVPEVNESHTSAWTSKGEAPLSNPNDDKFLSSETSDSEMQSNAKIEAKIETGTSVSEVSGGEATFENALLQEESQLIISDHVTFADRPLSTQLEVRSSGLGAQPAPNLDEESAHDRQPSPDLDVIARETKVSTGFIQDGNDRQVSVTPISEEQGQVNNSGRAIVGTKPDSNHLDEKNHIGMSPIGKHYGISESLEGSVGMKSPTRLPVIWIGSLSVNDRDQTPLMSNTGMPSLRPVSAQVRAHGTVDDNPLLMEMANDLDLPSGSSPNYGSRSVDSGIDDFISAVGDSFDIQSLRGSSDHTEKSVHVGSNVSTGQSSLEQAREKGRSSQELVSNSLNVTEIDASMVEPVSPMAAALHMPDLSHSSSRERHTAAVAIHSENVRAGITEGFQRTDLNESSIEQQSHDANGDETERRSVSLLTNAVEADAWTGADTELHEAMALLHNETSARSEVTSKGGVSTPMSDFRSAAGSLDDAYVGEFEIPRSSWMDDSIEANQVHENRGVNVTEDAISPSANRAHNAILALSHPSDAAGSDGDPQEDAWHDTAENSFELPGPTEGVDTSQEADKLNLVQEKKSEKSFISAGGRGNNYGTLPETSSFTSLSWGDNIPPNSNGASDRPLHQDLSNSIDEDSQIESQVHDPVGEVISERARDLGGGNFPGDIFRPQYLDQDGDSRRRIDFSAVSSVTSASSPSTVKVFQATGVISPIRMDESRLKLRSGYEQNARPPLFPRGMDSSSHHHTHSVARDDSSSWLDKPSLSQFLKRTSEPTAKYIQAEESIFALMDDSSGSTTGSKSSEGSMDESSADDMGSTELSHQEYPGSEDDTSAAIWNMLSNETLCQVVQDARRPDFVLMPLEQARDLLLGVDNTDSSPIGSALSDAATQSATRRSQLKKSQKSGSFKVKLEQVMARDSCTKVFPADQEYSDSSFAGGSLGRGIGSEKYAQLLRSHSSPDLKILKTTPADIFKQLDATSPLPLGTKVVPPSQSFSEGVVPGVPQPIIQDESDFANDETHLETALKDFATIPDIDISLSSELIVNDKAAKVASIRWHQLVAKWSHQQVFDMICRRSTSLDPASRLANMGDEESTGGRAITWNKSFALELQGLPLCRDSLHGNYDAVHPLNDDQSLPTLTKFLTSTFGGADISGATSIPVQQPTSTSKKRSIEELIHIGSEFKDAFVALLEHLAGFAVETDFGYLPFEVCLKTAKAANAKATSKYRANCNKVLDILRGRIIFPDEGSLVCALVKLFQLEGNFKFSSDDVEKSIKFKVVRIKNLFHIQSRWVLPTGYRHILLNILLDDVFIVELQFNLLPEFAVLGENGPKLHLELRQLQDAAASQDIGDDLLIRCIQGGPCTDQTKLTSYLVKSNNPAVQKSEKALPLQTDSAMHTVPADQLDPVDAEGDPPESAEKSVLASDFTEKKDQEEVGDIGANEDLSLPSQHDNQGQGMVVHEEGIARPTTVRKVQRLSSIKTELHSLTIGLTLANVWKCLLREAVQDIKARPRDLACLHCFLLILDFILNMDYNGSPKGWHAASGLQIPSEKEEVLALKEKILRRALAVGYHASSASMIGWVATLEQSGSTWHKSDGSLEALQELGACLAEQGKWLKAQDVFQTLVLRCERNLTLQHPITIACMLDLAVSATATLQEDLVRKTMRTLSDRMAAYLAEMEHCAALHYQQSISQNKSGFVSFNIDAGRQALPMLEAFLSQFQSLSKRKLMTLVPHHHEVLLAQHCIAADCAVVIANCQSLVELSGTVKDSTKYWEYAFNLYARIFKDGVEKYGVDDPRIASAAYGCARCLREMGKVREAINVLMPVAKAISGTLHGPLNPVPQVFTFIPHPVSCAEAVDKRIVAAQCQCLLAVLTADNQPNDEGRKKALKFLQKASVVLRHTLDSTVQEDPRRKESMILLHQIEEEARRIFHPLGGT